MKVDEALRGLNRLFLDSGPVIYYIDANPEYLRVMDSIFEGLNSKQIRAVTSPVTLAECLVLPIRQDDPEKQQVFVEILTSLEMADFVKTDATIAQRAAEVRVRHHLKLPDALQIATAIESNCDAFSTNDAQLNRVTELRMIVISELEV
ncbi:MAG: PIN domain-containing protein [Phormidesmis sp. CAN_BIN44]|nr:PIN domain-containing protein [Phormidesmis sp. CAN_BIN44]